MLGSIRNHGHASASAAATAAASIYLHHVILCNDHQQMYVIGIESFVGRCITEIESETLSYGIHYCSSSPIAFTAAKHIISDLHMQLYEPSRITIEEIIHETAYKAPLFSIE